MIKKIFLSLILFVLIFFAIFITTLLTVGIETNKFNKIISEKVSSTKNVNLKLKTVRFKLDFKELSLFLETQNPYINYKNILIPVQNIKVYIDFLNSIKSGLKIKKVNLLFEELDISQVQKLSGAIKPSNFKSFLNNKIKKGVIISEVELFINEKSELSSFIAKGKVNDLEAELANGLKIFKTEFSFFADKDDILIKKIFGKFEDFKILDGDVRLNLEEGIKLNSNFNSEVNLNEKLLEKYDKLLNKYNLSKKIKFIDGNFNNNIFINLDKTYKIIDYKYESSGLVKRSKLKLTKSIKNDIIIEEIKNIYLSDIQMKTYLSPKKFSIEGAGKYSFNNSEFLNLNFDTSLNDDFLKLSTNFDFKNIIDLKIINYKKTNNSNAKVSLILEKKKNIIHIKKLNYEENNNFIKISDLKFKDFTFRSFNKLNVKTQNNEFFIQWGNKIFIKGNKFDATNLPQFLSNQNSKSKFNNINHNIEIDFKNINVPLSEKITDFRLIGEIQKGKFVKISSKGDFGDNNFLDISMKKDKNTDKRFLEIYSDLTQPLLTEYNFFKGLSGGKLFFTSLLDGTKSNSKLKIENFKVVNAPALIKLLSLADLGGLADLAEGEGLSYDLLEINMEKKDNFLKINEIIALGPSMSIMMEGYQDENGTTSLRGTLVPAKTLNKIISKIPVLGNIVIPKEVGEGLFGISFKMKGAKGKIKTTINPIRTLTPRFIQKIVDKNKKIK